MKKHFILVITFLAILFTISIPETAEAQPGRRGKSRVVKRHVRVVRVHHPRVVRRAHFRYAALPRWGATFAIVPAGAILYRHSNHAYHFHNGIWYTPRNNNFIIVRPVAGLRVRTLPVGYRRIVLGTRPYYYYYGTFYSKVGKSEEYEVVDAPEGAVVDALPDGYDVKEVNGVEYYYLDGVYYAEVDEKDFEDGVGFEVVKL